jgi:TAG lipase/steryl ester hydrolase/phospholipase A2/LPA acyltransferase
VFKRKKLGKALANAVNYGQWKRLAREWDIEHGLDKWKRSDRSRRYDFVSIRKRLEQLRGFRASGDNHGLLYTLNEGIHGNMGGMGNPALYNQAKFGTKQLISEFIDELSSAIEYIASDDVTDISFEEKVDFIRRASICCGRSAIMLSGSGTLLYFHLGVVKALLEEDLLPTIMSGSSGGSIVSAILGTHSKEELEELMDPAFMISLIDEQRQRLEESGASRPNQQHIRESLAKMIPADMTFAEAEKLSGIKINVSIAPAEQYQTSRLMNAITSPTVYVLDAVVASAAVPGVFPPVQLTAKNAYGERQPYLPGRLWVDGSVTNDLPAKRLMRMYQVNHFVVSQTNPHIVPFISDEREQGALSKAVNNFTKHTVRDGLSLYTEVMKRPLKGLPRAQHLLAMANSVINQDYTGDINILPPLKIINVRKLLSLRTEADIILMVEAGERSTWPKMEMIRIQTKLSRTIDQIQKQLLEIAIESEAEVHYKKAS